MKCEDFVDKARIGALGFMEDHERWLVLEHVSHCDDCKDALRGSDAMRYLHNQPIEAPAANLYARIVDRITRNVRHGKLAGFWYGAAVGGSLVAGVFAVVVTLGLLRTAEAPATGVAEFYVSTAEAREMNIAIDALTALPGAKLSLTLYGGIELAGYASQRHLSWTTDLDAGVNKLALPVIALDQSGGQVIVQLEHPDSHQEFLVQVRHDS